MDQLLEWENCSFDTRLSIKLSSQKSFLNFTRLWFEIIQGEELLVNWHHRYMANAIDRLVSGESNKSLIINIPPGGTKTEFFSIHMPAYINMKVAIGDLTHFRNLNLSFSDSLVQANSRRTRDIISSKEYQELWQCTFGVNQAENWEVVDSKGKVRGQTVSRATGGQVTGKRGGFWGDDFSGMICLDDPDKPEDMFSPTKRETAHRRLTNTIRSRRGDKSKEHPTPFVLIQQRLHVDDTTGFFLSGKMGVDFEHVVVPLLIDEKYIESLPQPYRDMCWNDVRDSDCRVIDGVKHWSYWPDMEHIDQIIELKNNDSYTFESQGQQKPTKLSGGLLDTAEFGIYEILPTLVWRGMYVDTNSGKVNDRNDYTVFTHCGMSFDGKLYVIEVVRGKWGPSDLQSKFLELWKRWNSQQSQCSGHLRYAKIEDKQAGQGLITDVQNRAGVIVSPVERGADQNKVIRHHNTIPYINAGKVFIPKLHKENGDPITETKYQDGSIASSTEWVVNFLSECDALTYEVLLDKEDGYDDQYDTLMDAIDDSFSGDFDVFSEDWESEDTEDELDFY
jgi:predicted phage terminase large subunit-like protein